MSKYGIDNVRGGTYIKEVLEADQKRFLQKEIWGARDLCTRCGRNNHFIQQCFAKKDFNGNVIDDGDYYEPESESETDSGDDDDDYRSYKPKRVCYESDSEED